MILFVDTISSPCFLGIFNDKKEIIDEIKFDITGNESQTLIPNIDKLLKNNNKNYFDIKNIIIVNGPGSFTGIRTSVLAINTINFIIKKDITPISFFELCEISFDNLYPIIKDSSKRDLFFKKDKNSEIKILDNSDFLNYLKDNNLNKIYGDTKLEIENIEKITNIDYKKVLNKIKFEDKKIIKAFYLKKPNIS